jgi:hypothetical protein
MHGAHKSRVDVEQSGDSRGGLWRRITVVAFSSGHNSDEAWDLEGCFQIFDSA